MYFTKITFTATYAVILSQVALFVYCENKHLDPAIMSMADDTDLMDIFSVLSGGDYLYTSEMRDMLQDGNQTANISEACSSDISRVIEDIRSNPPKLYAAQSKCL